MRHEIESKPTDRASRVSVLHWNRPKECLTTITVLRSQGIPLSITVIDNGSTPENRRELELGLPPDVEFLPLPANIGWGPAHNVVLERWLKEEDSEFCVVSAHDALPQANCLPTLIAALRARADYGMVCPEYGVPEIPSYSAWRGARLLPVAARPGGTWEDVEYCHGTLMVARRQCLAEIGVFSDKYFAYGDETEIGLRARRSGWKIGLVWGAILINPGSWSGGPVIAYLWTRNSLRLAQTFGGGVGLAGRMIVVLLATLREWVRRSDRGSMSSPPARLKGVVDFMAGYCGGPPHQVRNLSGKSRGEA